MKWIYLYFFCISLGVSFCFTGLARRLAAPLGFLDTPSERKIHAVPMPMLGGVAIFFSFFVVVWAHLAGTWLVLKGIWAPEFLPREILAHTGGALRQIPKLAWITAGGTLIAAAGLIDDRFHLTPRAKLFWQFLTAILVVAGGIRLNLFMENPWLTGLVSVFWLVTLMNAFNLLDNMDGLSAGVALIASLLFAGIAIHSGQYFLASSLLVLGGTLAGFLFFNFPPASIFMGDCGSQLIGYLVGVLTILETFYSRRFPTHFPVLMPLLILAVPLYDTASVIVIRTLKGESILRADKRHFSHRLHALGMSLRGTVLFIYLVTLSLGLGAVLLPFLSVGGALLLFLQALCVIAVIALLEFFGSRKLKEK